MTFPFGRFAAKFFRKYYIEQLVFFVTARCNMRCKFCFYFDETDSASMQKELDLEKIEKMARSMSPFYILNIGGGEPFLRNDLDKVCGAFVKYSKIQQIIIPTNGWFTDRIVRTVKNILSEHPGVSLVLILSINGVGDKHDETVGIKGAFDRLTATYKALLPLKKEHPNLSLTANTTLTNENQTRILDILKYLDENYDFDDLIMAVVRFKTRVKTMINVNADNYKEGVRYLIRRKLLRTSYPGLPGWMNKVLLVKDIMRYRTIIDLIEKKEGRVPCCAGTLAVAISEEGKMMECEIRKTEIGRLAETGYDFNKLYFSKRREETAAAQLSEKCACTYECYLPFSIMFDPFSVPETLRTAFKLLFLKDPGDYIR